MTHLFAEHSSKISDDLYEKILNQLESKNLDFKITDKLGRSPLHYACKAGCLKLIEHLIAKGLDVNQSDNQGTTPLGLMAVHSFIRIEEFCRLTQSKGLEINKKFAFNKVMHTILTYIIFMNKSSKTFTKMIELGANINLPDGQGFSPLIHGIRKNKFDRVVSMVTNFKADTKFTDNNRCTVIHHVVRPRQFGSYENVEMLNFLINKADYNAQDSQHKTPLDYARQQQSGRLAEVLEKHQAKETSSGDVRRVNTSIINEIDFP